MEDEKENSEHESREVKSVAVVKNSSLHVSPHFSMLQRNTNLNVPPSNWLRKSSAVEQSIQDFMWHKTDQPFLGSIQMAENNLELTGEVDVITNARNIKKLLKIPYSRSHLSMMVHRVGKSLLLDEFDIHKHLLRKQQEDWKWLREFYYNYVAKDLQMKFVPRKDKSRDKLKKKNMYSKFLYHSIADMKEQENEKQKYGVTPAYGRETREDKQMAILQDSVSDENTEFHREIEWSFEDIQMLIGTSLPIFGGNNYPCISLRLRDMHTPINVLTGLDYWLDNLMCNVPELAMCFHLNGIVQKYELIKTEDIPNLKGSQFDPLEVTEIAQNILSFLKSKATKEGHTYWLYKGVDDEVVKLYDLTALSNGEETNSNPFTDPLGILLYRVARNLKQQNKLEKLQTIRTLLESCLLLLGKERHSQVTTSAHYLLSDVYVPDSALHGDWMISPDKGDQSDEGKEDDCRDDDDPCMVEIKDLCVKQRHGWHKYKDVTRLRPITGTVTERCHQAMQHIAQGLQSLDLDFTLQYHRKQNIVEEQVFCNRNEAIPLHYEPLKKSAPPPNKTDQPLHDTDNLQIVESESPSWHRLSKVLLLRKCGLVFFCLARDALNRQEVGTCFRYVKAALKCYSGVKTLYPDKAEDHKEMLLNVLSLCGDAHLKFIHANCALQGVKFEANDYTEEEMIVLESVEREIDKFEFDWSWEVCEVKSDVLLKSLRCYDTAISLYWTRHTAISATVLQLLQKRLGNVKNEIGVFYMNQAQECLQDKACSAKVRELCILSEKSINEGIGTFEFVGDTPNIALLLSNKGRLMRLQAQYSSLMQEDTNAENRIERKFYNLAIDCYHKALNVLGNTENYSQIRESISWELSTTYYTVAVLLQENSPANIVNRKDLERDVTDLMTKSLKYCEQASKSSSRQLMYQYRAASVNHRLASLFHSALRNETTESRRKHLRCLSESHYKKAASYYNDTECYCELLRINLEIFALWEYYATSTMPNVKLKLKTLYTGIGHLLDCIDVLNKLEHQLTEEKDANLKICLELESLLDILISRLQFIFLNLNKHYTGSKVKKSAQEILKTMYAASLRLKVNCLGGGDGTSVDAPDLAQRFKFLLTQMRQIQSLLEQLRNFHQTILLNDTG